MDFSLLSSFFLLLLVPAQCHPVTTAETGRPEKPNNETIYKDSKSLCKGCPPESLEFLANHNMVRVAHGEAPLGWDPKLEKYAKWWAGERKKDCDLEHSFPDNEFKYGENVFWGGGSDWTPKDAVSLWAGEEKDYKYKANTCKAGHICDHYTQIVWKTTQRIGCARVVCDNGDLFMTCNYDPPGNYYGQKPY